MSNRITDCLYLWLDDVRDLPKNDLTKSFLTCGWALSVRQAKDIVLRWFDAGFNSIYFDLDHDLGDFAKDGGDAIKLIDWLIENYHDKNMNFKFHFHSMNPVGVENMKNAVNKYWTVV